GADDDAAAVAAVAAVRPAARLVLFAAKAAHAAAAVAALDIDFDPIDEHETLPPKFSSILHTARRGILECGENRRFGIFFFARLVAIQKQKFGSGRIVR